MIINGTKISSKVSSVNHHMKKLLLKRFAKLCRKAMNVSSLGTFNTELDKNFKIYPEIYYALVDRCTG